MGTEALLCSALGNLLLDGGLKSVILTSLSLSSLGDKIAMGSDGPLLTAFVLGRDGGWG